LKNLFESQILHVKTAHPERFKVGFSSMLQIITNKKIQSGAILTCGDTFASYGRLNSKPLKNKQIMNEFKCSIRFTNAVTTAYRRGIFRF
jgi:hypothetical protein